MTAPVATPERPASERRPTVLFVDDEDAVRLGLRTALRKLRRDFTFVYAASGAEALEILATRRVDLIVSDMRMPGMTGADLLHRVRDDHPTVVRYVLSGEAEEALVLQAMPVVHRWLSKPCDRERLSDAVADALRYRDLRLDDSLAGAVVATTTLPSPPARYTEMLGLLADPDVELSDVAAVAEQDPAVAAKVLQLANSAFASSHAVTDIRGAVARIGISAVTQLALSAELVRALDRGASIPGFDLAELERHASRVSALASQLVDDEDRVSAGVAGLLSHVGLLLEIALVPDRLREAHAVAEAESCSLIAAERRRFGVGHAELAGHLLSIWGLPTQVVLAVAGAHDHPPVDATPPFGVTDAVRAARLVAQAEGGGAGTSPLLEVVPGDLADAVDRWTANTSGSAR